MSEEVDIRLDVFLVPRERFDIRLLLLVASGTGTLLLPLLLLLLLRWTSLGAWRLLLLFLIRIELILFRRVGFLLVRV